MTVCIEDGAERTGRLSIYEEGLMTVLEADCEDNGSLCRLALSCGGRTSVVGVLLPTEGRFRLRRSFSPRELKEKGISLPPDRAFILYSGQAAQPAGEWREAPLGLFRQPELAELAQRAEGTLVKTENGVTLWAVPVKQGRPFAAMPIFCLASLKYIGGESCAVFRLRDGELIK